MLNPLDKHPELLEPVKEVADECIQYPLIYRIKIRQLLQKDTPADRELLTILETSPPQWGGCLVDPKYNRSIEEFPELAAMANAPSCLHAAFEQPKTTQTA